MSLGYFSTPNKVCFFTVEIKAVQADSSGVQDDDWFRYCKASQRRDLVIVHLKNCLKYKQLRILLILFIMILEL
jgi:hypothetical protein